MDNLQQASDQLEEGEVQATEEEQQQLEQFFYTALEIIHGEGAAGDRIAKTILESKDVSVGIGSATAVVLIATEKRSGAIPDDIKIQLALEIIAELSGLAVEAGALAEDEIDDSFIDGVVSNAYSSYLSTKEAMGELDPAELEQSVSEAEQITGTSVRGRGQQQQPQQQQPQQQQPQQQQQQPQQQQPQQQGPMQGGLMSMAGG